jgi:hypothetical protein
MDAINTRDCAGGTAARRSGAVPTLTHAASMATCCVDRPNTRDLLRALRRADSAPDGCPRVLPALRIPGRGRVPLIGKAPVRAMVVEANPPAAPGAPTVDEVTPSMQYVAMPRADVKRAPRAPSAELWPAYPFDPRKPSCPRRDVKRLGAAHPLAGQYLYGIKDRAVDRVPGHSERGHGIRPPS